jgi:L-serine dehydratase
MARELMDGDIKEVLVEFDRNGSLATTHESQGSDMGLFGGLLGWEITDERLADSAKAISEAGIQVDIRITEFGARHPNTYKLALTNETERHELIAISTGGGIIEIIEIDGAKVSIAGDYYETLIYLDEEIHKVGDYLSSNLSADHILVLKGTTHQFIEIKSQELFTPEIVSGLLSKFNIKHLKSLSPLLPVLSGKNNEAPFITCHEMLKFNADKNLSLWELAVLYECARGNLIPDVVFEMMKDIAHVMEKSIQDGIKGTDYADRILGFQSGAFKTRMESRQLLEGGLLNQIILYVTAVMEVKSSMGVIVAAPTAGACGALPGASIGAGRAMGLSSDEITKAMLAAGVIGIFIAAHSTFAAEVGGCQAECGAASAMAAAALVTLGNGTLQQAIGAASMAIQNTLGMICDPIAKRVEAPCLGKNVLAASNALACANMALADFDPVIPLDEVIETMDKVGRNIPCELKCTALGGLSVTKTSKLIEKRLEGLKK